MHCLIFKTFLYLNNQILIGLFMGMGKIKTTAIERKSVRNINVSKLN